MDQINIEIPIFLDSMFFYLRLQADTYAELVAFYPGREIGKIGSRSFRSQFKWFLQTQPDFDVPYREILLANLGPAVAGTLDRAAKVDRYEFLQTFRLAAGVPFKENILTWSMRHPQVTLARPSIAGSRLLIGVSSTWM